MNVNDADVGDLAPRSPCRHTGPRRTVMTVRQLRSLGLPPAEVAARCRPGGPWQLVLPHVCLLHSGPPSSEERVTAALLYAGYEPRPLGPGSFDHGGGEG